MQVNVVETLEEKKGLWTKINQTTFSWQIYHNQILLSSGRQARIG